MKPFLRTANSPSIVYWTRLSVSPSCKMPRKRSKIASNPAQVRKGCNGAGYVSAPARRPRRARRASELRTLRGELLEDLAHLLDEPHGDLHAVVGRLCRYRWRATRIERSHGLLPTLTSSSFKVPSKRTVSTRNAKISWLTWWFTRWAMNLANATAVTLSRRCERRDGNVKEILKYKGSSKCRGPHPPCTRA